jgi:ABC-type amino acid transport substrate-binding protein
VVDVTNFSPKTDFHGSRWRWVRAQASPRPSPQSSSAGPSSAASARASSASPQTEKGWSGFDVDLCRALAAAIFDDAGKVRYVPLNATERFAALQSGSIDMLSRNSTWTMSRETELKLVFPAVTYYDGQGFMIRRTTTVSSALELGNTKVCVQQGTRGVRPAQLLGRFRQRPLRPIGRRF